MRPTDSDLSTSPQDPPHEANAKVLVLLCHGTADETVPMSLLKECATQLRADSHDERTVRVLTYPGMGHEMHSLQSEQLRE